jgi:hypothetical protein
MKPKFSTSIFFLFFSHILSLPDMEIWKKKWSKHFFFVALVDQLIAEHSLRISLLVLPLTPMLLIFTMDFPNSTLKLNPSRPLTPKKRWTKVWVEASVHSFWSDSRTPRPLLKFVKKDVSNLFGLPVSSPTRLVPSPFCGQSARSWGRKAASMVGSAPFPVVVKLYSLYLKNWQADVPMVCPPYNHKKMHTI